EIARMSGSDPVIVKALNPELTRFSLPPSSGAYWVRIPVGTYDTFVASYKALPEAERQPASEHTVLRGETLSEIARRYGTTVAQVKSGNNLKSNTIRVGQKLAVPVMDYAGPLAEATDETGGELVHYGRRNLRPILPASPSELPIPVLN